MALIEPVLVFLMGVMIGGIIIVMYLPIFNLAEVIR
jgi:type II secretory pathway component PulF